MEHAANSLSNRFAAPPSMRLLGWIFVAMHGSMFVIGGVIGLRSIDAQDRFWGWFGCIEFGLFLVMSVCFLAAGRKHVLTIGAAEIEDRGVFRTRRMQWSRVASVQWRRGKSRCHTVVLRDGGQRLAIHPGTYGSKAYFALVRALRDAIPVTAAQRGWEDEFLQPSPPRKAAHNFKRIFRFTCAASGIGWLSMMAVWLWLWRMEPQTPELWDLALGSTVACAFFPGLIGFGWWLETLDKRTENCGISSTARAARAAGDADQ